MSLERDNDKIGWLQAVIAIVTLVAAAIGYILVKEKELDVHIGWELVTQVLPDIIAALLTLIVIYFVFVRKGISSQRLMIEEIVTRVGERSTPAIFSSQSTVNKKFDLKKHLHEAKEILILGYSCRYLIAGLRLEMQEALINGTNIRIIVMAPHSDASALLLKNQKFKEIEVDIQDALQRVREIKKVLINNPKKRKGVIEVRTIDWVPSCSLIIVRPKKYKENGTLRLKLYAPDNGTPLTKIDTHMIIEELKESSTFHYFTQQFESLWEKSKVISKEY